MLQTMCGASVAFRRDDRARGNG